MQFKKAQQKAKDWEEYKNNNPEATCNHEKFDKEYYLGAQTGDYICVKCGETFTKSELEQLDRS